ncbi:MAG: cation diffusion facilitator family transporter [Ilumatobacteraceae bacterium]
MHEDGSRKAILAAFFANLGIAISKFVGFLITGSAGLLAEAGHSLADTGNQLLLLLGGRRAAKAADTEHPFGYGRERYFWAFVVALVLFSMGGLFALYEGISKLRHPHEVEQLPVAIGILLFAVALESYSLHTAYKEANRLRPPQMGWYRWIRGSKRPELPVVLLEDTGALVGLGFALFGVILAHLTGNPRWDAAGSIAIGLLLIVIAILLAVEMKGLLIGESASKENVDLIGRTLASAPSVRRVIHLRTEHLGPDELLVATKLEFDPALTLEQLAVTIDTVEQALRAAVPIAHLIYIEPDVYRPTVPTPSPATAGPPDASTTTST